MESCTVVCVYWKGSFRGREKVYSVTWVERLKNMVSRNISVPYKFVCLSNVDVPCERIPLERDWPGWWSKIELFRPGLFEGRVLYLDLDLVILDRIESFIDFPAKFATIGQPKVEEVGNEVRRYNSSVMVWDSGEGVSLYTKFSEDVMEQLRGDQDWIGKMLPDLETFPPEWVTKLRFCPNHGQEPAQGAKIILCMPGKNESASRRFKWVRDLWI